MASKIFRHNVLCACSTCGDEWFGKGGEASARSHALNTGHQVEIQILHRETINLVGENSEPEYAAPVVPPPTAMRQSVHAARSRVSLFEGPSTSGWHDESAGRSAAR